MNIKVQSLVIVSVIFIQAAFSQNTYVLNNNYGAAANYRTLQGALDSVPAGSIILMQGTGIGYGYANVTKPVVIYGTGYLIGQNNAPYTQANTSESRLDGLSFSAGSQGSVISGLNFQPSNLNNGGGNVLSFGSTNNITVSRCRIRGTICYSPCRPHTFVASNSTNITISQCYIPTEGFMIGGNNFDITFKNNIINGLPNLNFVGYASTFNCTFQNNSFYGRIQQISFANCTFINNVIISPNPSDQIYIDAGMAFASHNVSNVNIFPAGGTNITNADGPNTYVLYSNPAISSEDGIFQLKPGSAALGYGNDGTDAGAYGTTNMKYVFSGIPAIPNIYFANPSQVGTSAGGLKIQLKIKANN